jgi:prepilin-type N-terminal cleavage/methylation domain-containing protein/prepilin-type processing-associated H-X9-DG protein
MQIWRTLPSLAQLSLRKAPLIVATSAVQPSKKLGFTLVELLVTVAIISILAAILFLSAGSIRNEALLSKDIANLRSLQMANTIYASDHRAYVPEFSNDENGTATMWVTNPAFLQYLVGRAGVNMLPIQTESPVSLGPNMWVNYGYNITGLPFGWGLPNVSIGVAPFNISDPSSTLAFADALDWNIDMADSNDYTGEVYVQSAIAYPYDGKTGIVYFDGHAEILPRAQVVNNADLWTLHR